jgi:hypothetical protein
MLKYERNDVNRLSGTIEEGFSYQQIQPNSVYTFETGNSMKIEKITQ